MAGSHELFANLTSRIGHLIHHSPGNPIVTLPLRIESDDGIQNLVAPECASSQPGIATVQRADSNTECDKRVIGIRTGPCAGFDPDTAACKITSAFYAANKRHNTFTDSVTVYLCPFSGLRNGDKNANPNTFAGYTCIMPLDTIVDLGEILPGKRIDGVRRSIKRMTRDLTGARQATIADSIYRDKAHLFKRISIEIDTDT